MTEQYLKLKEIHRELLRQGRFEDAERVLSAMRGLVATGAVPAKELEAGSYI